MNSVGWRIAGGTISDEFPRGSIAIAARDTGRTFDRLLVRSNGMLSPVTPAGMAANFVLVGRFQVPCHIHGLAAQVNTGGLARHAKFVV